MVWMGKFHGYEQMGRVYRPDLMVEICAESPRLGLRHYLYGGADGVANELNQKHGVFGRAISRTTPCSYGKSQASCPD